MSYNNDSYGSGGQQGGTPHTYGSSDDNQEVAEEPSWKHRRFHGSSIAARRRLRWKHDDPMAALIATKEVGRLQWKHRRFLW